MRIEQLIYMIEISKTNSMTLAAKRLFVTQQTISQSIQTLEKELDKQLLIRSNKGVSFTKDGETVLNRAKNIMREIDYLHEELNAEDNTKSSLKGKLGISVSPYVNYILSPKVLSIFCKKHPKVNLSILEKPNYEVVQDIVDKRTEFGIVASFDSFFEKEQVVCYKDLLEFEILFYDELLALAGKNNSLTKRKSVPLETLSKYPLALNANKYLPALFPKGKPINVFLDTCVPGAYLKVIEEDLAIGFATKLILKNAEYLANKNIIPLPITNSVLITIGLLKLKNTKLTDAGKEFLKVIERTY